MSSVLKKQATAEAWDQWVDSLHAALADAKRRLACQEPLYGVSGERSESLDALMRSFHLLKGSAQFLGLHGVQRAAHDLESRVVRAQGASSEDRPENESKLRQELEGGIRKLDSVLARLHELTLEAAARNEVRSEQFRLSELFARIESAARGIATELGLALDFGFTGGGDVLLPEDWEAPFEAALLHAVRNSIDHGAQGSRAELQLRLTARRESAQIIVECSDSGVGINPDSVREAARARYARFDAEMGMMSDHEVMQLLFLPGLSLSRGVSKLSGRGYGLNIVRDAIEIRLQGSARIESTLGAGTRLILRVPARD